MLFGAMILYFSKREIKLNKIDILLILYFIFIIVSAILGENPVFVSCKTIWTYIQFPLLFVFLNHMPIAKTFPQKLFNYILFAIYIQIPIVLIQRIILKGKYLSSDLFTGTLGKGSTGLLTVLISFGFSIIFARILFNQRVLRNSFILVLLVIPVIISSGKYGHILAVIITASLIIIYLKTQKIILIRRILKYFVIVNILLITMIMSIKYIMPHITTRETKTLELLTSPTKMIEYGFVEKNGYMVGRLGRITTSYEFIKKDTKTLFFGFGTGTLSKSRIFNEQSEESRNIMDRIGPSIGISAMLIEVGFIGLAIYFYLLYAIFRRFYKIYILSNNKNLKCLIIGFIGIIISLAISMVYVRPHIDPIVAFTFWAFAGLIERAIRTNKIFEVS